MEYYVWHEVWAIPLEGGEPRRFGSFDEDHWIEALKYARKLKERDHSEVKIKNFRDKVSEVNSGGS